MRADNVEMPKMNTAKNVLIAVAVATMMLSANANADADADAKQDAVAANARGDYVAAIKITRPLAEKGEA